MKKHVFLFLSALVLFSACGSEGERRGDFRILLTDAPIDADQILVNYREISVHRTGGAFETIWTGTEQIDLIQLRDQEVLLLDTELDEGFYTQIRFVIDSGQVVVGGVTYQLEVPSSEVEIVANFEVKSGGATWLVLDFDADKSVQLVESGQGKKYVLRPVILVKSINS